MAQAKIRPASIPAVDTRVLCATVLESVERYFSDPENQRRFEAWKHDKEEKSECLKSR